MIDIFETLCIYAYILIIFMGLIRLISFKNKNLWPTILLSLHFISNISFCALLSGYLEEYIEASTYLKLYNALILSIGASFLSIVISHYVKDLTNKKIKTLVRIPFIGFLLGYALSFSNVVWLYILLEVIVFSLFIKQSKDNQYIYRVQLRSLVSLGLMLFVDTEESIIIPIYFFIVTLLRIPIINGFIVKSMIMKYDTSHD